MKALVQRVAACVLSVDGKEISRIDEGLICYLGIAAGDTEKDLDWMVKKVAKLRIFPDKEGKMNLSAIDLNLGIMVVPQFTLLGDIRNGYRPSFTEAEQPERANHFYEIFLEKLKEIGATRIARGVFAADMTINQINRGPVTIELNSR